jgi:hypothetical protein
MFLGYHVEGHNATTFVGDRFAPEPDVAIYTQEPSRNVLIATSKPPLRRRLRKFAHLAAAAAGARGAGGAARPLGPPGARVFQRFFKALEAPKPLEPTGLPPCLRRRNRGLY